MKKIFTIVILTVIGALLTTGVFAQSPEKMSYQAVVRNSVDELMINHSIGMQISILQGSEDGVEVYVERQFPQTNNNGLVSINIGEGTIVTGNFADINWGADIHFIKTEIDLNGGANYSITGVSQLLSVPYALHAKTAETATGTLNENDPVFTSSEAANITAPDITNLGNLSGINTGDQDISGIAANTQAIQDTAAQIRNDIPKYSVGDFAMGGVVFWVDESGQHGLIAAKEDQSTGIRWYAGTHGNTQANGDGPYAGEANTSIIIAAHVAIGDDGNFYAARLCNQWDVTEGGKTYADWYLPSRNELLLMYQNREAIDSTAMANGGSSFANGTNDYYWSSTENYFDLAWTQGFDDIGGTYYDYKDLEHFVRAVRAF